MECGKMWELRYVEDHQQLGLPVSGVGQVVIEVGIEAERLLLGQSFCVLLHSDVHLARKDVDELFTLMLIANSPWTVFGGMVTENAMRCLSASGGVRVWYE
jgi:hypothetical protein